MSCRSAALDHSSYLRLFPFGVDPDELLTVVADAVVTKDYNVSGCVTKYLSMSVTLSSFSGEYLKM